MKVAEAKQKLPTCQKPNSDCRLLTETCRLKVNSRTALPTCLLANLPFTPIPIIKFSNPQIFKSIITNKIHAISPRPAYLPPTPVLEFSPS